MYKALYRKYRPLQFSDVVGQEHVTTTLQHQVEKGNVSHAYLFTGSRGTGKTTCAKILSRAINCLNPQGGNPCGECENCRGILKDSVPDVLEIDAASNNGVDYIRELRERIAFAPQQAKFRVYIIDEVHMLSTAASNALLKTLEEPPKHAVFILATTEINAILPTILSRCQRYDFHRIEPETIVSRLKFVAEQEGVVLTDVAAATIATIADGGMRDALSILDLCAAKGVEITDDVVNEICGRASTDYLFGIAEALDKSDTCAALEIVAKLHSESVDMQKLCGEMCEFYRTVSLIRGGIEPRIAAGTTAAAAEKYKAFSEKVGIESAMNCLRVFNDALSSMNTANRRSAFEMAVIKLTTPQLNLGDDALLRRVAVLERQVAALSKNQTVAPPPLQYGQTQKADAAKEVSPAAEPQSYETPAAAEEEVPSPANDLLLGNGEQMAEWNDIVATCFKTAPLMAGLLNGSTATHEGNKIIIHSESAPLRAMMSKTDELNYKGLRTAIFEVMGCELIPVMEKERKIKSDDPMLSFMDRLNNL